MKVYLVIKEDGDHLKDLLGVFPTLYSARCFFIGKYDEGYIMTVSCWEVGHKELWSKRIISATLREKIIADHKRLIKEDPYFVESVKYWENTNNFLLVRGTDMVLTLEEIEQYLQEEVDKRLKTTPENFKKAWEMGLYDYGDVCELLGQAFLLPKEHPWHIDLVDK